MWLYRCCWATTAVVLILVINSTLPRLDGAQAQAGSACQHPRLLLLILRYDKNKAIVIANSTAVLTTEGTRLLLLVTYLVPTGNTGTEPACTLGTATSDPYTIVQPQRPFLFLLLLMSS